MLDNTIIFHGKITPTIKSESRDKMKRFELRIPDELHAVLAEEAKLHGLSLHQLLLQKVAIPWKKGLESWYKKVIRKVVK